MRLLQREHIVAASLVGSVVVVIGFASGLGTRPGTGAAAAPETHPPATAPVTPTQAPQTQPRQGHSTGSGYTGGTGGGVVPITTAPNLPPGNDYTGHPMPPPTTTTTTPPAPTTPPPTCQPGFVPTAVDTLLGTLGDATNALGLGSVPSLIGTTVTVLPALPALPEGTPLDQLVATCQPPPAATTTTAPTR